jgi:imidazolonepropionase
MTFLGAHSVPPEYQDDADGYVELVCRKMIPAIAAEKLADAVDGFCEGIAFSPKQIERIFDTATQHKLAIKLHAGQLSDLGSAELAARYKALSADHLEYTSEAGVQALAKAGTVAVLLPGAFYMLRETQKPPVELLRRHGVPMAVASDSNPGTSPTASLLLMLNMGCVLFGLTPEEALAGVTRHAAKALGMEAHVGTLEKGKAADMALWDIAHPEDLAYNIGYNPCIGVIRQGLYRAV